MFETSKKQFYNVHCGDQIFTPHGANSPKICLKDIIMGLHCENTIFFNENGQKLSPG